MLLDIQACIANQHNMPTRRFQIAGAEFLCLCDSGACTTVMQTEPPGFKKSRKVVWVRSASGHTCKNYLSEPLAVTDVDTGRTAMLKILVDPSCPINLLGRDAMCVLQLAVIPVKGKMQCVPVSL